MSEEKLSKSLGQVAFETLWMGRAAYQQHRPRSFRWEKISPDNQKAWQVAAEAVATEALARFTRTDRERERAVIEAAEAAPNWHERLVAVATILVSKVSEEERESAFQELEKLAHDMAPFVLAVRALRAERKE